MNDINELINQATELVAKSFQMNPDNYKFSTLRDNDLISVDTYSEDWKNDENMTIIGIESKEKNVYVPFRVREEYNNNIRQVRFKALSQRELSELLGEEMNEVEDTLDKHKSIIPNYFAYKTPTGSIYSVVKLKDGSRATVSSNLSIHK